MAFSLTIPLMNRRFYYFPNVYHELTQKNCRKVVLAMFIAVVVNAFQPDLCMKEGDFE